MQSENNKNKTAAVIFGILSLACMAVIFWFSSRDATESTEQSNVFVKWLMGLFGGGDIWVFIVRKSAHCLEFAGLSLLVNFFFYFLKGKPHPLWGIGTASLYAVTDEVHQLFVEGRSCRATDWAIDTAGAALGALGFYIIYKIISAIKKRKQK